ncbi:MAG TPA: hypothetical protein VGL13_05260 [Polyangiaceae bacterium]|jgi:hypothetical protein
MTASLLIHEAEVIVTMDAAKREIRGGSVLTRDHRIERAGTAAEVERYIDDEERYCLARFGMRPLEYRNRWSGSGPRFGLRTSCISSQTWPRTSWRFAAMASSTPALTQIWWRRWSPAHRFAWLSVINGRVVVKNGALKGVDLKPWLDRHRHASRRMLREAGLQ